MSRWKLALYGAIGAVAPDALILYSKRWTAEGLHFEWHQYVLATAIYVLVAGLVASIFPYGKEKSEWKAFAVGVCLPVLISGLLSTAKADANTLSPRGLVEIPGRLSELMALR